jgi:hypothetical protein
MLHVHMVRGRVSAADRAPLDGLTMIRTVLRHSWLGCVALAWLLSPHAASAWGFSTGCPIPVSSKIQCQWQFDVMAGPAAFVRPTGPWYSYFPMDSNLIAQPRATAYPNWPSQFPPVAPAPAQVPMPMPMPMPMGQPMPPMGYYTPTAVPYAYSYGVYPVNYYAAPGNWYGR